ncbi:LysE family translocator [Vibrio ishigakensis]|nr:LysE family translocator [Vibrio ishigakensis]
MDMTIWLAYVATVLVLISTPGPSQILMLSNSMGNGFSRSLYTAAGDLTANFIQMIIASVGLVSVIANSQEFFTVVKWGGVAYLVYLGLSRIFSRGKSALGKGAQKSKTSLYWQGFITSAANPKAVIFFAALFPQFINTEGNLLLQFGVLSSTYLLMDGLFLCCYGKFAVWISQKAVPSMRNSLDKVSGSCLILAAFLLGLKEVK